MRPTPAIRWRRNRDGDAEGGRLVAVGKKYPGRWMASTGREFRLVAHGNAVCSGRSRFRLVSSDYGFTSVSKTRTFFHDALFSSMNWVWRG